MATTLNMTLLLRRDDFTAEAKKSYVLQAGEPGYCTATKMFKVGDGSTVWSALPFANQEQVEALIAVLAERVKAIEDAPYATEGELNTAKEDLQDAIDALALRVKAVEDSLAEGGATANAIKAAQDAADAAQADVDDLTEYVGTVPTIEGVTTVVDYINKKTDGIATSGNLEALAQRVGAIENAPYATKGQLDEVDAKFGSYTTTAAQQLIDAEQDRRLGVLEAKPFDTYATKDEVQGVAGDLSDYETANDNRVKAVEDEIDTFGDIVTHNAAEFATAAQGAKADAAAVKADVDAAINAINAEETGILAQAKSYVDSEDKFEIDMNTINALGGIAAGSDLNNMTTHDILKKLLYPYVDASIGNATAKPSNGGTVEVGSTQTITGVDISVTKKSEPITSIVLYNGSEELARKEGAAIANGTNSFTGLSVPVTRTTTGTAGSLRVTVTYPNASGVAKSVNKDTNAFTFVLPYYYGVCSGSATLDADLISTLTKDVKSKGDKTYTYNTDSQKMVIAYPKAHNTLKLVKDGNGLDNTGVFGTPVTVSFTNDYGVTADYYIYASGVNSGSAKMTFTHN